MSIIEHEHHVSVRHPRMSVQNRAAQFAPFAALTGYDDVIRETGRETDSQIELDEMQAGKLDETLNSLLSQLDRKPSVRLTVFEKDRWKSGGRYITLEGRIRQIDLVERKMVLSRDRTISLPDILDIQVLED